MLNLFHFLCYQFFTYYISLKVWFPAFSIHRVYIYIYIPSLRELCRHSQSGHLSIRTISLNSPSVTFISSMMAWGCGEQKRTLGEGNGPSLIGYPSNGCFSGLLDHLWTQTENTEWNRDGAGSPRSESSSSNAFTPNDPKCTALCNKNKQIAAPHWLYCLTSELIYSRPWWSIVCRLPDAPAVNSSSNPFTE